MEKKSLSQLFENIGTLLEIKGENPFKARAYHNAARTLEEISDLDARIASGRMKDIKGIGEALAAKIKEYSETGVVQYYEDLKREVPESLLELLRVPNLGPKKISLLFHGLGVTNIGELEYACKENRLTKLTGFGKTTQEKIMKGIEFIRRHSGEFLFPEALAQAEALCAPFEDHFGRGRVEVCGSIRRRKEVVRDIDLLVASEDPDSARNILSSIPAVAEVLLTGTTKTSCRLQSGIEADLRVVRDDQFPSALLYFTGSKEHNVRLRGLSKRHGWKLNEYGLYDSTDRVFSFSTEAAIYDALGLSYIVPELREDMGEIEASMEGSLPQLVTAGDVQGLFHVHTDFSDGTDSLEKMVDGAKRLGFSFLGLSDHSRSAPYAGGLREDDLERQWELVDRLNSVTTDFVVFKGIESDILPDGSLDYDEDILKRFDFVIASIHSGFAMKKADMEARIIRAIHNPYTTMLGHPTGRLLLSREGFDIDMTRVIDEAAASGTIIELNASPYRLDIDWRFLKYAKERNVLISVNPDAHSVAGLAEYVYGIGIARKGWLEKKDVFNTRNAGDIGRFFSSKP